MKVRILRSLDWQSVNMLKRIGTEGFCESFGVKVKEGVGMPNKYIWMGRILVPPRLALGGIRFRWQWAVQFDICKRTVIEIHPTRKEARRCKRDILRYSGHSNVIMTRRLVQTNWEPYCDTFKHNAKGNGNGR